MLQHFIIEGKYLGHASRVVEVTALRCPPSYGFYCMGCGDVYAKCPIEGQPWVYHQRTCRKCRLYNSPATNGLPGSIQLPWDEEFTEAFPLPVLRWEFERELEYYDKGNL
jgi:hypothetical protein